ncbi:MAG: hypothetical protein JXX29_23960 [Deltaproteobacteria bacterium]|nr:hypothetical protein [Deltaproteobacteria bacterium]MBN2674758.1 hypothetical protein [Deltaproteobacteria bacterium]
MFKLIKLIIGFIVLLGFSYFLFFVPLGSFTLYQHLRNISNTDEAHELGEGIKEKASFVTTDVVENVPELKQVDEKVEAVKTAVSSKAPVSVQSESTKKVQAVEPSSSSPTSPTEKVADISNRDRSALSDLIKSKTK